jgi:hypothetical protein
MEKRIWQIGLLVCVLMGPGPVCNAQENAPIVQEGSAFLSHIEKVIPVSRGGTLTVIVETGPISVESWDRDELKVVVEKQAEVFTESEAVAVIVDYEVFIEAAGNSVSVRASSKSGKSLHSLRVNHKFMVPSAYNVDLKTEAGAISVSALEGEVKCRTSGGSIHVGQITNGSVDIRTAGGKLKIEGIRNGDGTGRTSGGSIEVGDVSGNLAVKTSGGRITLGTIGGILTSHTAGGRIKIEQTGSEASVHTSGGSIKISRAEGSLEAKTAGGSISIGPSAGRILAKTSGGSIKIESAGSDVEASTSGGNIKVDGSTGLLKVSTRGGNIRIRGARGAIEAQTSGGGIDAQLLESNKHVDTHCKLESSGGNIIIHLPGDLAANIQAKLKIRRKVSRDYQIYSDFPIEISGTGTRMVTGNGKINGGGHLIDLNTTDGDIKIKKGEK